MTETKRYWLECSCGQKYKVGVHQAGNDISCDCGKSLQVPSMIQMKKLPPAFVEEEEHPWFLVETSDTEHLDKIKGDLRPLSGS